MGTGLKALIILKHIVNAAYDIHTLHHPARELYNPVYRGYFRLRSQIRADHPDRWRTPYWRFLAPGGPGILPHLCAGSLFVGWSHGEYPAVRVFWSHIGLPGSVRPWARWMAGYQHSVRSKSWHYCNNRPLYRTRKRLPIWVPGRDISSTSISPILVSISIWGFLYLLEERGSQ